MKTNLILACLSLGLASCGKQETAADEPMVTETAAKPYPLGTCLVSGEKLGSMGDPHVIVHEGREIKFCCSHCEPDFRKEPDKYLSQLDKE